jgi:DNA-3-methyladenine glycosylase I
MTPVRCAWAQGGDAQYLAYHDHEWGVPVHDDRKLFEFLILEGAQAGLSWSTILKKREGYRAAFADFDPVRVAAFGETETAALLLNPGIVRNRLKIAAAVTNARAFLEVQSEFGSFDAYVWRLRRRASDRQCVADAVGGPGPDGGIRRAVEGPRPARLQVRRHHDHVRAHAGDGDGERPYGRLLSASRTRRMNSGDAASPAPASSSRFALLRREA